jgi:peptidoglycan hydrolase CwlO-like protein
LSDVGERWAIGRFVAIQGLRNQIDLHLDKINFEQMKQEPNEELIRDWEQEIEAFTERLERLESRLAARRRRGRTR